MGETRVGLREGIGRRNEEKDTKRVTEGETEGRRNRKGGGGRNWRGKEGETKAQGIGYKWK